MESEVVVWLVIIAFWLISNLLRFLRKLSAKSRQPAAAEKQQPRKAPQRPGVRQPPPPPPPARQPAPPAPPPRPAAEEALTELLKSFGVEIETPSAGEQPVASEHVRTRGEHTQAASQTRGTISEHDHTPGWHERSAGETTRTASEHSMTPSFHRGSAGEHDAGDVFLPDVRLGAPATAHRRIGSRIGRRVVAEVHGDRDSLARAFLLREVLGPPVGLRSPQDRSFER